jgi:hypothetical protein
MCSAALRARAARMITTRLACVFAVRGARASSVIYFNQ